ncbi:MAG TPA: N-acetylglucosamine-6-phosphate deacetylase [Oscillospiraceae bacterium]|nr:N-acetylglucosamine-6-phosphate deacetylase [Oscillospiraceae bacterium]
MTVFKNAKIVFQDKIRSGVVVVNNGKITGIHQHFDDTCGANVIDCKGNYLSPGFVDIHVHGGGGKSAMSEDFRDVITMCEAHLAHGTTSILPTTLAAPFEEIKRAVLTIKKASEASKNSNILGVHLEGPYLSKEFKGAQSEDDILSPLKTNPDELFELWDGIRLVGAAPEIEGGLLLGEKIVKHGAVASIAHSGASYEIVEEAVNHGYSDVTHIYSACSMCFKVNLFRVGGVVEAGLAIDELTTQAIADLRHLPAGLLKLIYKCKGADKMILITDALEFAATNMEEGAVFKQKNGVSVVYEDGVMKLADRSSLAGSVATSAMLVRNVYKSADVPLYDAVRAASHTPASRIGFGDRKGKIQIGYDADLVVFDEDINIKAVMTNGNIQRSSL